MLGEHLTPSDSLAPLLDNRGEDTAWLEKRAAASRYIESVEVLLRPSSSSQRHSERISGLCKNISQSGCGVVADTAARVGDVYRIEVPEETSHALHGLHVRCVRCHLLDEEAFESGFFFLTPIVLSELAEHAANLSDPLV